MMATQYDQEFDPPAPVTEACILNPARKDRSPRFRMIIDTGADLSVIPLRFAAEAGLQVDGDFEAILGGGGESKMHIVYAVIVWRGKEWEGRYGLIEADFGLLGRDLINDAVIKLDGPKLAWRILK